MLVKLSVVGFIGAFLGGFSETSGVKVLLLNPLQKIHSGKLSNESFTVLAHFKFVEPLLYPWIAALWRILEMGMKS